MKNDINIQKENKTLKRELRSTRKKLAQAYAMIDYLRKERFGAKKKKNSPETEDIKTPRKKGPPFGHKGITRKKPEIIDEEIIIPDPQCCPDCKSNRLSFIDKEEHTQEEIILPQKKVTKYIRSVYKCNNCNNL